MLKEDEGQGVIENGKARSPILSEGREGDPMRLGVPKAHHRKRAVTTRTCAELNWREKERN